MWKGLQQIVLRGVRISNCRTVHEVLIFFFSFLNNWNKLTQVETTNFLPPKVLFIEWNVMTKICQRKNTKKTWRMNSLSSTFLVENSFLSKILLYLDDENLPLLLMFLISSIENRPQKTVGMRRERFVEKNQQKK